MTKDEALKMALGFIERVNQDGWILADFEPQMYSTIAALKEALAQPEEKYQYGTPLLDAMTKDYVPPQRTWVGLTDEERNNLWREVVGWGDPSHDDEDLMKAIEAKLKEKNT